MCCRAKDNTTALACSLQIMNALVCYTSASREGMLVLAMAAAAAWAKRALARTCRLDGKARWLAREFMGFKTATNLTDLMDLMDLTDFFWC